MSGTPTILLIDDDKKLIEELEAAIRAHLPVDEGIVKSWIPNEDADDDIRKSFREHVSGNNTVLVITDEDLSTALKGLSGTSVVAWCQALALPVGDFSRGVDNLLPKDPDAFELRIPSEPGKAAEYIVGAFRGFEAFRSKLKATPREDLDPSLASVLAMLVGKPHLETQFAPYVTRLASANTSVIRQLLNRETDRDQALVYVLGHVMLNAIVKFPGPLMHEAALCAYVGAGAAESDMLCDFFKRALYHGPFHMGKRLFWTETVDATLDAHGETIAKKTFEDFGDLNRAIVEHVIGRPLAPHSCERCGGTKGGFWCPFKERAVCPRDDCSVPSSSWIPEGANVCRVERDFYDEWAPVLGL